MKKYKIIVAYDGTDYCGWQIQPKDPSIVETMQKTWLRVFGQPITIIGASRTDSGVHALGQIAMIKTAHPAQLTPEQIKTIWNAHLPPSIMIRQLTEAQEHFHPCCNVKQKTYLYTIFLRKPLPMVARYGWHYQLSNQLDLPTFQKCLELYKGTHDFASFCKIEDSRITTVRTIDDISIKFFNNYHALVITVKSAGFARFQIRRMIGSALDVSRKPKTAVDCLQEIIHKPCPRQTLTKAESCGLCLRKVVYHNGNE